MKPVQRLDSRPVADPRAVVRGDRYRITVLTDGLVRLEHAEDGAFEDATKYSGINAVLTTQKLTELVDLLREQSGDEA